MSKGVRETKNFGKSSGGHYNYQNPNNGRVSINNSKTKSNESQNRYEKNSNYSINHLEKFEISFYNECTEMKNNFSHYKFMYFIQDEFQLICYLYFLLNLEKENYSDDFSKILSKFRDKSQYSDYNSFLNSFDNQIKKQRNMTNFEIYISENPKIITSFLTMIKQHFRNKNNLLLEFSSEGKNIIIYIGPNQKDTLIDKPLESSYYIYNKISTNKYYQLFPTQEIQIKCVRCSKKNDIIRPATCEHYYCYPCIDQYCMNGYCSYKKCFTKFHSRILIENDYEETKKDLMKFECPNCEVESEIPYSNSMTYFKCQKKCKKIICLNHRIPVEKCNCFCQHCFSDIEETSNNWICKKCNLFKCKKCKSYICKCFCKICGLGDCENCLYCSKSCQVCLTSPENIIKLKCSHLICISCLVQTQKQKRDIEYVDYCRKCIMK